jgi:hypothetical protein
MLRVNLLFLNPEPLDNLGVSQDVNQFLQQIQRSHQRKAPFQPGI